MTLWTVACQAPLSLGFSRQEYWSGLPFPSAGDLPDLGIELMSLASPALQAGSLPLSHLGSPKEYVGLSELTFDNQEYISIIKVLLYLQKSVMFG